MTENVYHGSRDELILEPIGKYPEELLRKLATTVKRTIPIQEVYATNTDIYLKERSL